MNLPTVGLPFLLSSLICKHHDWALSKHRVPKFSNGSSWCFSFTRLSWNCWNQGSQASPVLQPEFTGEDFVLCQVRLLWLPEGRCCFRDYPMVRNFLPFHRSDQHIPHFVAWYMCCHLVVCHPLKKPQSQPVAYPIDPRHFRCPSHFHSAKLSPKKNHPSGKNRRIHPGSKKKMPYFHIFPQHFGDPFKGSL